MKPTRRRLLAAGSGLVAAAVAGCTGGGSDATTTDDSDPATTDGDDPEPWDVGMGGSFFRPAEIEVAVGETVVWKNTGSRAHTVTAYEDAIPEDAAYFASGGFDSQTAAEDGWMNGFEGAIQSTETYEHTFEVPGEYGYFCVPHEPGGMIGTVVVTE